MSSTFKSLAGAYRITLEDGSSWEGTLPGTLDTNNIGFPDQCAQSWHPDVDLGNASEANTGLQVEGVITTRFTRKHTYTGKALYERTFSVDEDTRKMLSDRKCRVFLHIERSRLLSVTVDGTVLSPYTPGTLSTKAVYELTDVLRSASSSATKEHSLTLACDNSYPGMPKGAITYSSAATDETQTNWNGFPGDILLETTECTTIRNIRVYPHGKKLTIFVDIDSIEPLETTLTATSEALDERLKSRITLKAGRNTVTLTGTASRASRWDESEGNLHNLEVTLSEGSSKSTSFGIRDFASRDGRLTLNGRNIFLRSESNCAVYPESGYVPMKEAEWEKILRTYASYGVNCVRFHSHCPPEAAFSAADKLGMLIQPELSNWDPKTAFDSPEAAAYYRLELSSILREYANHPSFVMLTLGNELHYSEAAEKTVSELLSLAKETDSTRLYANASNPFYGHNGPSADSDFYTSAVYKGIKMRGTGAKMTGHINQTPPCTTTSYENAVKAMRQDEKNAGMAPKPLFSFEVGQYEVLPDFSEIALFKGISLPENLKNVQKQVQANGFSADWQKRIEASGELALRCYREEVEAALRTSAGDGFSGISLLGLQDFPGQGTALVGMLNSHLLPKPFSFASPERFRAFFAPVTLLAVLDSYTFATGSLIPLKVLAANYGKSPLSGKLTLRLIDANGTVTEALQFDALTAPEGFLTPLTETEIQLKNALPGSYTLELSFAGYSSRYTVWLFEETPAVTASGSNRVSIARTKAQALNLLSEGKRVFLEPEATEANFPKSMETCFSTDFWSVGTFAFQSGYMGILTEPSHPVFRHFPTEYHADWQWWHPTHQGRAFIQPEGFPAIIEALDCYARLRRTSLLSEFTCNGGSLILSGMGLLDKQDSIECRNLLKGILEYMGGDDFSPEKELDKNTLSAIIS